MKVPVGLPCLDVQQVLGYRSLQLKAKARVKDTDRGGSSLGEIMSSRVLGVVPWERLLFSGWHLALLTFSSLPTSLGTSLTSDLFSKCFADSYSSSLKCGVPRGFHHQVHYCASIEALSPAQNSYVRLRPMSATTFKRKEVVAVWTDCPRAITRGSWLCVPFLCTQDWHLELTL